MSPKSAIFIFPLVTHTFHTQTSRVTCNFTSILLDELSACVVSCWCILRVACTCENDRVACFLYKITKSTYTMICECMFHTHHSKSIPICLEWHSCGVACVASSCIFHVIFHFENFQVITIGVPHLPMQHK
jgi:hypothetical protein